MKNLFRKRSTIGFLCIILSLILTLGIAPLLNQKSSDQTSIVRLVKNVSKGSIIASGDLETVHVGAYHLPADVLSSPDNVIGQYATVDMLKGDYLLPGKLSAVPLDAYVNRLNGTKQAISISIKSLAAGLSGKLQSGDIVTLIASDYGELRTTTTPPELQYVEVLAVTTSSGTEAQPLETATTDSDGDEQELPSTLTLLALPQQAAVLADLENKSKLHVALVYRGNAATAKTFTDKQDAYFTAMSAPKEEIGHE
ncbi:RcpC/CpaB family pilus assembly protein [Paenibacillus sp. FSL E2-0274]|uniref:Flp pilus assembly protein CpaB n=1 Tax=Paenibacillus TaxID=44249 RepID=UPI00096FCCE9|nr:RcpC/CpaB family pilus assembly protein [Paenibacillus odorifer]OME30042.1 pilus assembly protein CpaB [Paenibacillus odorifer]